jgi:hypothetical protein
MMPRGQTVSCVTVGLHSVEWDYDYAGMELEHLEDIPRD